MQTSYSPHTKSSMLASTDIHNKAPVKRGVQSERQVKGNKPNSNCSEFIWISLQYPW